MKTVAQDWGDPGAPLRSGGPILCAPVHSDRLPGDLGMELKGERVACDLKLI